MFVAAHARSCSCSTLRAIPAAPYAARIAAAIYGGKGFALGVITVIIPVAQHQIIHAALPFQRRCKAGAKAALCVICPHRAVAICRYGHVQHIGHGLRAIIQARRDGM